MTSAPADRTLGASGVVALSRLLGQGLGASLVALCLERFSADGPEWALRFGVGFAALGAVCSLLRLRSQRHPGTTARFC